MGMGSCRVASLFWCWHGMAAAGHAGCAHYLHCHNESLSIKI